MYRATLDCYEGRSTERSIRTADKPAPSAASTAEQIYERHKPMPHTRPQTAQEHALWQSGVDTTGMTTAAIYGFYAAKQLYMRRTGSGATFACLDKRT